MLTIPVAEFSMAAFSAFASVIVVSQTTGGHVVAGVSICRFCVRVIMFKE